MSRTAAISALVARITDMPLAFLRSRQTGAGQQQSRRHDNAAAYLAPMRLGIFVCTAVMLGFGGWATFASISGAVVASGTVSVEGRVQAVQHFDGGIISEIHVRDGDVVEQGSLLLQLDSVALEADLAVTESRLVEALTRRARLQAERDRLASPPWPADLDALEADRQRRKLPLPVADTVVAKTTGERKSDRNTRQILQAKFPSSTGGGLPNGEVLRVYEAEVRLFLARKATRTAQVRRLRKSVGQAREQIAGLRAQRKSRRRQLELIKRELSGAKKLHKDGLVPLTRLLALERQSSEIEGSIAGLTAEIAATRQRIGQFDVDILKVEKDWQEMVLVDLRAANLEIRELNGRRTSLTDKLTRVALRAPVGGTVNNLSVNTVGGVIKAAQSVLEIVPEGQPLVVDAFVSPAQIDRLYEGQPARVRLSAFNANTTPELTGTLVHLSADLVTDEATQTQSYLVRVRIPATEIARLDNKTLVPGMPAELYLETKSRSPLSYLLKPLSDQVSRAGRER